MEATHDNEETPAVPPVDVDPLAVIAAMVQHDWEQRIHAGAPADQTLGWLVPKRSLEQTAGAKVTFERIGADVAVQVDLDPGSPF